MSAVANPLDGTHGAPLADFSLRVRGHGVASDYACALLASLGAVVRPGAGSLDPHPAIAWCRSGLMALTGKRDGPAQMCPLPIASCADGAFAGLAALDANFKAEAGSGSQMLGVRAGMAGYTRNGSISPGGSCRLLPTRDASLAVNLARSEDWLSVQAWLETEKQPSWDVIADLVADMNSDYLLERGRLLGLAVAVASTPGRATVPWYRTATTGTMRPPGSAGRAPLVIDLSTLWAGPLCGHLLQRLGARVIKVESTQRPDGARSGPASFHHLLNHGKASLRIDLTTHTGVDGLRRLIEQADIVIESSRPRALRQLGIDAEALVASRPGLSWISITGHGRDEPQAGWIGFGDDTGVAAGLSGLMHELTGEQLICGDAIADPLTGMHAALLAWSSYRGGGGRLSSVSLRDVLGHCMRFSLPPSIDALRERRDRWQQHATDHDVAGLPPPLLRSSAVARPLGADTAAICAEFGLAC